MSMTVDEGRKAYATILAFLRREREMRRTHLGEPRRSQAVKEADDAISALESLGPVLGAAVAAGLLDAGHEQAALIDVPPHKQYL